LTYVYIEYEDSISSWNIWNDDGTKMIVLHLFELAILRNSQNPNETEIYNELNTLICKWIPVFSIANLKYRTHKNDVFAFISFRYTITDIETPETF